jgi:predicted ATP-dependent serine protease
MSKTKSSFFCQHCGYESAKWLGKCPSCQQWNSFIEEVITKEDSKTKTNWKEEGRSHGTKTILISDIESGEEKRIVTKDPELNRVLGVGVGGTPEVGLGRVDSGERVASERTLIGVCYDILTLERTGCDER